MIITHHPFSIIHYPLSIMFTPEDEKYMRMAIREAEKAFEEKEIPIGCVIVKDGVVIGRGHNQIEMLKDILDALGLLATEEELINHMNDQMALLEQYSKESERNTRVLIS